MSSMPNLHLREVPSEAVETLRAAAKRNGRSLNAEAVAALVDAAARGNRSRDLVERLETFRRKWVEDHPDGYPPGLEPETIIRQARDSR